MKKIFFLLTIAVTFFACDNSLNLDPVDQLAAANFPKTDADAIAAVNGIYAANIYGTTYAYMIDLTSELTIPGGNPNGDAAFLSNQQWEPTGSYNTNSWSYAYSSITNANALIDALEKPETTVTPTLRNRIIGESKFLRALHYYYAVQYWGEIPIVLHKGVNDEGDAVARAEIDDVYAQIEQDLKDAALLLPHAGAYTGPDKGRVTWGAAKALLSKVYLIWGQTSPTFSDAQRKDIYHKSVVLATEVIDSHDYALQEKFAENWSTANRNGKEGIFIAQHAQAIETNGGGANHLTHCAFDTGFSQNLPHVVGADPYFRDEFDVLDQRRQVTYADSVFNPQTGQWFIFDWPRYLKYIDPLDPNGSASYRDIDRTVIRLAEVYLIRAEAINERDKNPNAQAYDDINEVRHRAFLNTADPTVYYITAANLNNYITNLPDKLKLETGANTYEQFKKAIQFERKLELTYEQVRRFDLIRWKILIKTLKASGIPSKQGVSYKNYRFPIPGAQRNINAKQLWQNWGYDGSTITTNPYADWE
ncbi:MAG: RagB/SusD family nutrient uptake outer membrane protein [Dysgonamonadaceae bacterium]|jgi:hypothetical protein|nr:RagB/SusD family nutrient uptake outer membrane protein [Dysgonamonadaceae bacterium]